MLRYLSVSLSKGKQCCFLASLSGCVCSLNSGWIWLPGLWSLLPFWIVLTLPSGRADTHTHTHVHTVTDLYIYLHFHCICICASYNQKVHYALWSNSLSKERHCASAETHSCHSPFSLFQKQLLNLEWMWLRSPGPDQTDEKLCVNAKPAVIGSWLAFKTKLIISAYWTLEVSGSWHWLKTI